MGKRKRIKRRYDKGNRRMKRVKGRVDEYERRERERPTLTK